ncbi:MAG: gluconate 2-dehydrogenase subunit 3 family protein, partial [Campylobacterota bacterium]|nr:gluconate 2-dehydrogenase subunit 3 family protein [Campylobacterota bacterium]
SVHKTVNSKVEKTIMAVQEHLFPDNSKIPSAKMMHANTFLLETISHKSYDKDIRNFVVEGAKELELREKGHFVQLSKEEKERALREYEETNYGSSWLSRIMTLTMEGMFSDPIYGANKNEEGWESLGSFGGQPRPETRYLDV